MASSFLAKTFSMKRHCLTFLSSLYSTDITFIGQKNLISKKTMGRNTFIVTRFIDNTIGVRSISSLRSNFRLIISYPLNFSTTELERFLVSRFFPWTFFCIRNLNTSRHSKNVRKKLWLERTSSTLKHVSKYPKIVLSSLICSLISSNSL